MIVQAFVFRIFSFIFMFKNHASHDRTTPPSLLLDGLQLQVMFHADSQPGFFGGDVTPFALLLDAAAYIWQTFALFADVEVTYARVEAAVQVDAVPVQELEFFGVPWPFLAEQTATIARCHSWGRLLSNNTVTAVFCSWVEE